MQVNTYVIVKSIYVTEIANIKIIAKDAKQSVILNYLIQAFHVDVTVNTIAKIIVH